MKYIKLKGLGYDGNTANYTYNAGVYMDSVLHYNDIGFRLFIIY